MNAWTPDAITALVIQIGVTVTALAGLLTLVLKAFGKLNEKVDVNTVATVMAATKADATAAKVDEIHAATVTNDPVTTPHG